MVHNSFNFKNRTAQKNGVKITEFLGKMYKLHLDVNTEQSLAIYALSFNLLFKEQLRI